MTTNTKSQSPDPRFDLVLERVVDVPADLVWDAWTTPEHLKKWFTPAPWTTVDCEIDLRPGGIFRTVMRSPEGKEFPHVGCYLEVVRGERLVWTNVLLPGYRPLSRGGEATSAAAECDDIPFTAVITIEARGKATKYTALAIHATEVDRKRHEEMGFQEGWGAALDQLVALVTKRAKA
jgi:uncharacterized protein YndB with AHSA1/START domain